MSFVGCIGNGSLMERFCHWSNGTQDDAGTLYIPYNNLNHSNAQICLSSVFGPAIPPFSFRIIHRQKDMRMTDDRRWHTHTYTYTRRHRHVPTFNWWCTRKCQTVFQAFVQIWLDFAFNSVSGFCMSWSRHQCDIQYSKCIEKILIKWYKRLPFGGNMFQYCLMSYFIPIFAIIYAEKNIENMEYNNNKKQFAIKLSR